MKRREFIILLGGAAAVWPLGASAQKSAMPVIGFLSSSSSPVTTKRIASFSQGLSETGYVASRDVIDIGDGDVYRACAALKAAHRRHVKGKSGTLGK